jgi:hypothetical protein
MPVGKNTNVEIRIPQLDLRCLVIQIYDTGTVVCRGRESRSRLTSNASSDLRMRCFKSSSASFFSIVDLFKEPGGLPTPGLDPPQFDLSIELSSSVLAITYYCFLA